MANGKGPALAVYCPDVPPVPGGVSDHTLALARALEERGHGPTVLARRGDPSRFAPLSCVTGLSPGDVAREAVRRGIGALLVQYVPFLFARRGVAPSLWRAASALGKAGVTLAVILHEPFVPFTRLPWLVTGVPQRLQLRHLVRRAAHVYAGVPGFAAIARRYATGRTQVHTVPIGATLGVSRASRADARRELGLPEGRVVIGVFSPAASGFETAWVARAAERLRGRPEVEWLLFGFGSDRTDGLPSGAQVRVLGALDEQRLGRTMRALDLAAQPYVDGLTPRRSGTMLALAHGVPVVSSTGHLLDPLCARYAACESDAAAFAARIEQLVIDPAARATWAARAARSAELSSIGPLADALVRDLAGAPTFAASAT